jgi:hypothetical protein
MDLFSLVVLDSTDTMETIFEFIVDRTVSQTIGGTFDRPNNRLSYIRYCRVMSAAKLILSRVYVSLRSIVRSGPLLKILRQMLLDLIYLVLLLGC